MGKFEDRLWRDLVREHGSELARAAAPAARHGRPRRRLLAGTGIVGLAGAGTVLALVLSAASSSPAFAVDRNSDGTVTIVIRRADGIAGANARLAAMGVPVRAVQVLAGCSAPGEVRAMKLHTVHLWLPVRTFRGRPLVGALLAARIHPGGIPAGRMLEIPAGARKQLKQAAALAKQGPMPACLAPPGAVARILPGAPCPPFAIHVYGPPAGGGVGATVTGATATNPTTTGPGATVTGATATQPGEVLAPGPPPRQALLKALAQARALAKKDGTPLPCSVLPKRAPAPTGH
jgi:hypothetical protein